MSVLRHVFGSRAWIRALVILISLCGLLVLIFAFKLSKPTHPMLSHDEYTNHRLIEAIEFLEESKRWNAEFNTLIENFSK